MAKIIAHFAKKAGGPQYSSNQFSASIEVESDTDDPEALRTYLRRCFEIAKTSVDEQMRTAASGAANGQHSALPASPRQATGGFRSNGNPPHANGVPGNNRFVPATASQRKAVYAICKSLGLDSTQYNLDAMGVSQASKLIDELKAQQVGNH